MTRSTNKPRGIQKYVLLADRLRKVIVSSGLVPGDRLPSLKDLHREHGVSQATAERAHALLEKEGLIVRSPYRGIFVAEPKRRNLRGVLGVALPAEQFHHTYYAKMQRGIERVAAEESVDLLLMHQSSDVQWEKVDGMILTTPSRPQFERLPPGMPAVSLLHPLPGAASVLTDDFEAMHSLTTYLYQLGHRRIAILTSAIREFVNRDSTFYADNTGCNRLKGYYSALNEQGIDVGIGWARPLLPHGHVVIKEDRVLGREAMSRWLNDDWHNLGCTALMAQNDDIAIGAIEVMHAHGLKVPDDVSVTAFDGLDAGTYFRPQLTTIRVPLEEIGACGARLLIQEVRAPWVAADTSPERPVICKTIPSTLQIGESTAALPNRGQNSEY